MEAHPESAPGHAPHDALVFGADEPATTGYRAWAACPCGAARERWVSVAEVIADLAVGEGLGTRHPDRGTC